MRNFNVNEYVDVQERIGRFWQEWPQGAIRTELASPASQFDQVVFRAEVFRYGEEQFPAAVGYAAEERGSTLKDGANFTSWHENAETSAIGRALANLGYATSRKDRPSRQEMQKVERGDARPPQQARTVNEAAGGPPATDKQRNFIIGLAKDLGMTSDNGHHDGAALDATLRQFCNAGLAELNLAQAKAVIDEFVARRDAARKPGTLPDLNAPVRGQGPWWDRIDAATTRAQIDAVGREMGASGVDRGKDIELFRYYTARLNRIKTGMVDQEAAR